MGNIHNPISRGDVSAAITKALGVTKGFEGVERFGETLTPTIDLWAQPEWLIYRNDMLAGVDVFQGAVAAEFSAVALVNPAGSGLLAVVEAVHARSSAAFTALLELTSEAVIRATLATTETRGLFRDRRRTASSARCSAIGGSDPTSIGGEIESRSVAGIESTPNLISAPIILPPGQGCVVRHATVNVSLSVSYAWRERIAYPGELL